MSVLRVDAALAEARRQGLERHEAQALLGAALGVPRSWLLAHGDAVLDEAQAARCAEWLARFAGGEPLAYLRGRQEFHGLELAVSPAVLVPRPDTETLVDWALEAIATRPAAVLDLGTGSGAIALAIARRAPAAQLVAVDASADALAVARANGAALGFAVAWRLGSWFDALAGEPRRRFDVIVSNPPYIAEADPHLAALQHEPALALVAGPDGLDALRLITAQAAPHLQPGGRLLLEHGHDQAAAVAGLLQAAGFTGIETRRDLAGRPRCTGGRFA
ncbi:MAG TPA: peptide chain release factor N(5)-glutamine methyltransferase [Methylibium sp.]|uniref:peptide chain release factor N(5)-glutamine methyltransferase n=1 Tax=Methylibium sp. TaxID=2067992 RepID=UPI002DB56918|nr:peptide chain release factor N(5)-glutamine methyltransferase [Methylibium sp.]HEU4458352.1 peptide chain release factor N(5)-glutamine methyltransferase [Methylibium sp.]